MSPLRLNYVLSILPQSPQSNRATTNFVEQTFIKREIIELTRRGVEISACSFRENKTQEKVIQVNDESQNKCAVRAITVNLFGFRLILSHLYFLLKRPSAYFWSLTNMLSLYKSPHNLIKAWIIFLKAGAFSFSLKDKIDHIHCHFAHMPAVCGLYMSALLDVPFSVTVHVLNLRLPKDYMKKLFKRCAFVIENNQRNYRILQEEFGLNSSENLFLIRNSLNLNHWPFMGERNTHAVRPIILGIGHLIHTKGFHVLINACHVLKSKGFSFQCVIIGEGEERRKLEQMTRKLGLENDVQLKGALPNYEVKSFFPKASVFVMPSVVQGIKKDGLPTVLIEALATGVPPIGTTVGSIPEILEDGETGLIVPEADHRALADAILKLLIDHRLRKKLSHKGRQKVEREFDLGKNILLLEQLFRNHREFRGRQDTSTNPDVVEHANALISK